MLLMNSELTDFETNTSSKVFSLEFLSSFIYRSCLRTFRSNISKVLGKCDNHGGAARRNCQETG